MSWRLLSRDPFTGIETLWRWDADNLQNVVTYRYPDCQPNLDYTAALRNDGDYTRAGLKGDAALHYAHIPAAVLTHWMAQGVQINDKKAMFEMVNKPEWKYLKTTELYHQAQG